MIAQPDPLNAVGEDADQRSVTATDQRAIPEATVARLATYLRALIGMGELGVATVSSESLAAAAGVNSAKLRKDLSYLGSYGVRGVGYDVSVLTEQIHKTLGLHQNRAVALIGLGHLGQALAGYAGFASRGFRIAALIDAHPALVGTRLRGLTVQHVDQLDEVVKRENIAIAVVAVPASAAQDVCDRLVAAGVTSILNFAPTVLTVPPHVDVRKVDLAAELQILSFHDNRKAGRADCLPLSAQQVGGQPLSAESLRAKPIRKVAVVP
ncbi:MAG TPA: redox-sensing transcriptional repressor Rex [Jatrophihabitans sp.]|jgi:redox-sensing transcriptional repressor|uniref:redox-sensing transcriptional repressor Rex n=1 Tax=Jatrophihabitans sp. TaxID=1932789 RepID=UPI002F20842A